ncbi:MAG: NUDIX hydrolase [Euzebya sp.]
MSPADLVQLVTPSLPQDATVLAQDPAVAEVLGRQDAVAKVGPDELWGTRPVDAVMLLSGEVVQAGERAPAIIDWAVTRCRPGGIVAIAVPSAAYGLLTSDGQDQTPALTAAQVHHLLSERGLDVRVLAGPGAGARLAGRDWAGQADLPMDTIPGLLDAGPVIVAVAVTPRSEAERSHRFFGSIAKKIVAASVICLDETSRLLVVFDTFKNAWTLPGGLVDAGENPIAAAVREAREEAGVDVVAGDLLGLFTHPVPDRIHLVYGAVPVHPTPDPRPLHDHEIAEVRWVELPQALSMMGGDIPRKVRLCLDQPGRTWTW